MAGQSPKTVATINFKGGVGKTTVTWCLADIISEFTDKRVLLFDLDAQMSLTQAITLNEATGSLDARFHRWYQNAIDRRKTIFDALDAFTKPGEHFDFPIGYDFIYQISDKLHFVPSVEDLYWLELDVFDRGRVKDFVRRLLGKITNAAKVAQYDYVLFDCPPSFTLLSYSVLASCDLILIPVNPDFFALKGTNLILNSLKMRIEPYPLPKLGVFMNKGRTYGGPQAASRETSFYAREVASVCAATARDQDISVRYFDSWVPERAAIKRAIMSGGVPRDLVEPFKKLWSEVEGFLQ